MSAVGAPIRFETKTQGGKAQIFWEKDRNVKKSKKVNYKTREQKFPLRGAKAKQQAPAPEETAAKPARKTTAVGKRQSQRKQETRTDNVATPDTAEIQPGTVTLTQEQLSAILTSIAKVTKENPLHISIDKETNKIKVEEEEDTKVDEGDKVDEKDNVPGNEEQVEEDEPENVLNLLKKLQSDKESTNMTESASLKAASRIESVAPSPVAEKVTPPKYLTVAEKKRLQWETERAELAKVEANASNPWGRPGAGAPLRDNRGDVLADFNTRKYQKLLDAVSPRQENPASSTPVQQTSSPSEHSQPSAIRSSFVIGKLAPQEDRFTSVKEEEKKRWLEDLELQREEQRLRKEKEKEAARADEKETWADKLSIYEPVKLPEQSKSPPPPAAKISESEPVQTRISSAPNPAASIDNTVMESMTFLRGQNIHLDALTISELQEKRLKHLEHQKAIQAQVEEKQRHKREEREKRIQEEREEERKLQDERETLQKQFNLEQEKLRRKEEEQDRRVQLLKEAMEDAQEKATHEKHLRRLNDLQKRGHDVSHLHKNFEASHTPRAPAPANAQPAVESSYVVPGLNLRATVNLDGASVPIDQIPVLNKVVDLSPRKEFGTQTDEDIANLLSSASYPNMSQSGTREDSAHIQFKGQVILKGGDSSKNPQHIGNKLVRVKSADTVKSYQKKKRVVNKRPTEQPPLPGSKTLWNYQNRQHMRPQKNSEKDPNYARRKKAIDARRAQREQELIKQAEANRNMIPVEPYERRTRSLSRPTAQKDETKAARRKTPEPKSNQRNQATKGGRSSSPAPTRDRQRIEHSPPPERTRPQSPSRNETHESPSGRESPPVPAVKHRLADENHREQHSKHKYGADEHAGLQDEEFVPFLRSSAFLDPSESQKPLPVSREATCVQRGRKAYARGLNPGDYGFRMTNIHDQNPESVLTNRTAVPKDPIMNPSIVQEHPTPRQEVILKQLQDIRKNLLQRQREIETCLSPSDLSRQQVPVD
ncbi:uncharacterized protein LOC141901853 isoform X2 [Tubulanus polymorphus]|uniref:uncharacterized protein LOC141901853 isoform X2 n=1 Tax=Tubulanus polymorphus TaxID=672921 RepID=UPI003DA2A4D9